MSDNSKPTQNAALSFEQWLGKTERLDAGATYGPWQAISTGDKGNTFIEAEYVDVLNHDETGHGHLRSEYAWMTKEDADWIAWSRTALPAAVAALRAILDLHAFDAGDVACGNPRHTSLVVGCPECYYPCQGCAEPYPCPTVAAIHDKIGDGHE